MTHPDYLIFEQEYQNMIQDNQNVVLNQKKSEMITTIQGIISDHLGDFDIDATKIPDIINNAKDELELALAVKNVIKLKKDAKITQTLKDNIETILALI